MSTQVANFASRRTVKCDPKRLVLSRSQADHQFCLRINIALAKTNPFRHEWNVLISKFGQRGTKCLLFLLWKLHSKQYKVCSKTNFCMFNKKQWKYVCWVIYTLKHTWLVLLTFEIASFAWKSHPPTNLNPQGLPPLSVTVRCIFNTFYSQLARITALFTRFI